MARVTMSASGRFGQLFIAAVNSKGFSLDDVAKKFGYSYEQMRKYIRGTSMPAENFLRPLCKYVGMNYDEAWQAANTDRMEKRFGVDGVSTLMGKDPRLSDIEPYLSQLNQQEWSMFVAQIAGYVRERQRKA